jgi:hypothetical protein
MFFRKCVRWLVLVFFISGLLAACGHSSIQIGFVENNISKHWTAHYTTFSGTKATSLNANEGQVLVLDYDVHVTKGILNIKLTDPYDEAIWEIPIDKDNADKIPINIYQDGRYTIVLTGEDAGGSWDITWVVQ